MDADAMEAEADPTEAAAPAAIALEALPDSTAEPDMPTTADEATPAPSREATPKAAEADAAGSVTAEKVLIATPVCAHTWSKYMLPTAASAALAQLSVKQVPYALTKLAVLQKQLMSWREQAGARLEASEYLAVKHRVTQPGTC